MTEHFVHLWRTGVTRGTAIDKRRDGLPYGHSKSFSVLRRALLPTPSFDGCREDERMARTPQVFRYRMRNWRAYNRMLVDRGRLTVWFDEHAIAAWRNTEPAVGPGAPRPYADLAIECGLVCKSVYHRVTRRQTNPQQRGGGSHAALKMRDGPSESDCGIRFQTP